MDTAGTDRGIVPIIGEDGVIRTDGSTILGADDKSGIAGCLELVRLLRDHPEVKHPTIEFVVTVGAGERARRVQTPRRRPVRARRTASSSTRPGRWSATYWSPDVGRPHDHACPRSPGRRRGRAGEGHQCRPGGGGAIASMPLGRIDEETVANIGTVTGGEARNVVPRPRRARGHGRSDDQAKLDAQLDAMRRARQEAAGGRSHRGGGRGRGDLTHAPDPRGCPALPGGARPRSGSWA